jgi:hypothetical protein
MQNLKPLFFLALFFLPFLFTVTTSCKHESTPVFCDTSLHAYWADVKPIMDKYCTNCHNDTTSVENGGIWLNGWANLNDYVINGDSARLIRDLVQPAGTSFHAMPLGSAKLSDCDITKIKNWIYAGAPNN